MAVLPPPSRWVFPPVDRADEDGFLAVGADLQPGTLLAAYAHGIFPMPVGRRGKIGWWSPDPRGVLPLDGLRVSRSLRAACRRFEMRVDSAFSEVVERCADPRRPGGWITAPVVEAYQRLYELGWAHSVEAWTPDGRLAGGLYGVGIGGLFAGESMFHEVRDASKVTLVALVGILSDGEWQERLLDVQWCSPHLRSLGAVEWSRRDYLRALARAVAAPTPPAFCGGGRGTWSGSEVAAAVEGPPPGAGQVHRRTR